ncbi:hypothetical protein EU546_02220 [Candidatus Thorarchaeota archaeon]|nr:MAG: hypothetical protein EU546_02220 [Candidatus Thorarchaeota archaeon]
MIIGKFAEDGSDLLWVTYYGDSINDFCFCLDVDSEDNIIVGGVTNSPNITLVNPIQDEFGGGFHDMMVAKINPEGTGLVFSTFYGGNRTDWMLTLRLDSHDNIWFGGYTDSSDYPVKDAYQGTFNGGSDCVVTQVSASGVLTASTFIGMVGTEQAYGIGFDSHDNAIVVGRTSSDDFPVHDGALQGNLSGSTDAFVLNMTQDFQSIPRCTLFGGSSTEMGEAIEVTKEGTIIIAGTTDSDDLVTSTGVLQENYGGSRDIFILWNPLGCPYESNSTDHPSTVDTSPLGLGAVIGCAVLVTGVVLLAVRRRH